MNEEQIRQRTYEVTLWCVRVTTVTMVKRNNAFTSYCRRTDSCQQYKTAECCNYKATMLSRCKIFRSAVNNTNVLTSSCEVPYNFVQFQLNPEYLDIFS